jgi:hypothetical protein
LPGADFFTTDVWTWRGLVTYYTVFVIELATRRVQIEIIRDWTTRSSTASRPQWTLSGFAVVSDYAASSTTTAVRPDTVGWRFGRFVGHFAVFFGETVTAAATACTMLR